MKLAQVFSLALPKAPPPMAAPVDRSVRTLLQRARREWTRLPRAKGTDFQDTQPSIRDTRSPPE